MKFTAAVATVVSTLFLASSAQAHVTANPSIAVSGAYFQTNFRVPHGCDGNATDLVIVQIPKGVSGVKPRITVPWVTSIQMVPLDTPIVTPTGTVNTTVGSVTWANGNLPDAFYEDFGLQFKLPVMNGPLYWNVMQHCTNGGWNNWTNVPDATGKTAGFPAAVITVANATTTGAGGSTASPDAKSGAGALAVSGYAVLVGAAALAAMF